MATPTDALRESTHERERHRWASAGANDRTNRGAPTGKGPPAAKATRSIRTWTSARRRCEKRTGAWPDRRCNPGAARAAASCEPPAVGPDIQRAPARRRSDRALAASQHRALTLGRRGRDSGRPEGPSRSNAARVGLAEARRDVDVTAAKRQLGHAYLSTTGTYLEGISSEEIIGAGQRRRGPTMHASAGGAMCLAADSVRLSAWSSRSSGPASTRRQRLDRRWRTASLAPTVGTPLLTSAARVVASRYGAQLLDVKRQSRPRAALVAALVHA